MTRLAITVDRVAAFLVGGTLVVVGVLALLWHTGLIPGFPTLLTAPALTEATSTWWWRWGVAGAGLACTAVALRWLAAHRPAGKAAPIVWHDSDTPGTLTIDPSAIASAAATALARHPVVDGAKGKAVTDRGERTIELDITAAHPGDLDALVEAIDATCADIARAAGEIPLSTRATLHVKGGRNPTRRQLD